MTTPARPPVLMLEGAPVPVDVAGEPERRGEVWVWNPREEGGADAAWYPGEPGPRAIGPVLFIIGMELSLPAVVPDEDQRVVSATDVHITAVALHCAVLAEAERLGRSVTSLGSGWDPDAREGFVDMPTTQLAEALLRAGWSHPPPPIS